jgi:HD superfamily phosphohydrolase
MASAMDNEFWASFDIAYDPADDSTKSERAAAKELIEAIAKAIADGYAMVKVVKRGGAGIVVKVRDLKMPVVKNPATGADMVTYRALKTPRPIPGSEKMLAGLLNKEVGFLSSLTHTNVVKVYACGAVTACGQTYPYYVMDFIEGATEPDDYARRKETKFGDILSIFEDVLEAFCYLDSQGIVHNDPKPANILINAQGRAIVSDLGSAKRQIPIPDGADETIITFTPRYAPEDKKRLAEKDASSANRARLHISRDAIQKWWDIFSIGRSYREILEAYVETHGRDVPAYEYVYVQIMIGRMLGREILDTETVLGLPRSFYTELAYTTFADARSDLAKLLGSYDLAQRVPELDIDSKKVVQCPMSGVVPWTERLSEVLKHPSLKRLASVSQLGLLNYVYPNASGTRYEHLLGSYGTAVRMVRSLWADRLNPLFRQIMTDQDIEAGLLAVLLHDLGQYPLAHDLEEADKELFSHEKLSVPFLDSVIPGSKEALSATLDRLWWSGMSARVKAILDAKPEFPAQHKLKDRILHTLQDGPIDADKLDYIYRDSMRLRVPYGTILDHERIIGSLTVVHDLRGANLYASLGIHEKGRIGAECVAFARYALFAAAYWHHTARAIKAMIHRAVWEAMSAVAWRDRGEAKKELYKVILQNELPTIQHTLFGEDGRTARPIWPGMSLTDLQMLLWVRGKTSDAGAKLLDCLIDRILYKRALLITDTSLPRKLHAIRREGWAKVIQLENRLTSEVAEHLLGLAAADRQTMPLSEACSRTFADRARAKEALVLVDIPSPDVSKMDDLLCLPEAEGWRTATESTKPRSLSESVVWKSLIDSLGEGTGKIRVFVHPDYAATLRALPRETLQSMVRSAVDEIDA